jgi:hypothetical protein
LAERLIRITGARNQAEAEMVQGLLRDNGITSILRRTRGFDVPDFLAAGPRDVLVPESDYEPARSVLAGHELLTADPPPSSPPGIGSPARLALGLLIAVAIGAALVFLLYELT